MHRRDRWMWIGLLVIGVALVQPCSGELRSPWDGYVVTPTDVPYQCPPAQKLSPNLVTNGFYGDSKGSIIDPKKWRAYVASAGPYKELGIQIVKAADAWQGSGSREAAICALHLMDAAAHQGVFTGKMSSRQAYYVQGWVIGAIAIAYLKVRDSGFVTAHERDEILPWIVEVVHQTTKFYEETHQKNNHLYWAGVEAVAAGVADNNSALFRWGVAAYRVGIDQIRMDGVMPLEMRRGRRALHYHLYALSPLVYIAEFGEDNGLPLYSERDHSLARLERLCVNGLYDNSFFVKAAHSPQDTPERQLQAEQISWGAIWETRFPNPKLAALLKKAVSLNYMYLGGLPPGAKRYRSAKMAQGGK